MPAMFIDQDEVSRPCISPLDASEALLREVDDREIEALKKSLMAKLERLEWLVTQPHQRAEYSPIHVGFVRSAIFLLNALWK